jgi:hypothetical protein
MLNLSKEVLNKIVKIKKDLIRQISQIKIVRDKKIQTVTDEFETEKIRQTLNK